MTRPPPRSTLFPYTTLFRSSPTPSSSISSGTGGTWRVPWCRVRSDEHTSELQSQSNLVCRLLLEKQPRHPFLFNDPPPPQIHPLSLHDALPIFPDAQLIHIVRDGRGVACSLVPR